MSLAAAVRSRLASLLRPWLQEEPNMEVKLGFLRSIVTVKDLVFDVSVLNAVTGGSARLAFERVKLESVTVGVSPWSGPALTVEIECVDVTLAPRDMEEQPRPRNSSSWTDSVTREKKETIASLDPEGVSLHDMIERIATSSPSSWLTTAIINTVLRTSRLQIQDLHLQLLLDDSDACLLKAKELRMEPPPPYSRCLFRGIFGSFLLPGNESSFVVSGCMLEIGLKAGYLINCITSLRDISVQVRLKDLSPSGIDIRSQKSYFEFSPVDILFLSIVLDMISPRESVGARNGRELWKIAALKIGYMTSNSSAHLYKIIKIAIQWIRYVDAYESLIVLAGYPATEQTPARGSTDWKFPSKIKYQWKLVSEIESCLPPDTIARARCVARHRAFMHFHRGGQRKSINVYARFMWRIYDLILLVFRVMYYMFFVLINSILFRASSVQSVVNSTGFPSQQCISLNLGEIYITLYPMSTECGSITLASESDTRLPPLLTSFCLVINFFCLYHTKDSTSQSTFLAFGHLKSYSSSLLSVSRLQSNWRTETSPSFGEFMLDSGEAREILRSEPAPLYIHQKLQNSTNSMSHNTWVSVLQTHLSETWLTWKTVNQKFGENNDEYFKQTFLLCEIKSIVMDPFVHRPEFGLWKCSLIMGRLNFDLDHSSIISITQLTRQFQHTNQWISSITSPEVLPNTATCFEEQSQIALEHQLEFLANRLKMVMLNMIPEKNIRMGMVIAGPTIRISMQTAKLLELDQRFVTTQGFDDCYFTVDLESAELAVWPTSKDTLIEKMKSDWMEEPRTVEIAKTGSHEKYMSQGRISLDVCLELTGLIARLVDGEGIQQCSVIGPLSMTIQSSSYRDHLHSFTSDTNSFSNALNLVGAGFTILSYMDELQLIFQALDGLLSALASDFVDLSIDAGVSSFQKYMTSAKRRFRNPVESKVNDRTSVPRNAHITINATFDLEPLDILLSNSRKIEIMDNPSNADGASTSSVHYQSTTKEELNLGMLACPHSGIRISVQNSHFNIFWEGSTLKLFLELSGIQSDIFGDRSQMVSCTHQPEAKDPHGQSCCCLYEFSLSKFSFTLSYGIHGDALSSIHGDAMDGSSICSWMTSSVVERPQLETIGESSQVQKYSPTRTSVQDQLITATASTSTSDSCLLVSIGLGEIVMAKPFIKNALSEVCQPSKSQLSISISGDSFIVDFSIQVVHVFLETAALAMFLHCFGGYIQCIKVFLSSVHKEKKVESFLSSGKDKVMHRNHSIREHVDGTKSKSSMLPSIYSAFLKEKKFKDLLIRLSQFSLALSVVDGCGETQIFIVEAEFYLKSEGSSSARTFLLDIPRLSVLFRHLNKDLTIPKVQNTISVETSKPLKKESYILRCLSASINAEKQMPVGVVDPLHMKKDWEGNASVTGFDIRITLSEIELLLALVAPFSGTYEAKTDMSLSQSSNPMNREHDPGLVSLEHTIPDGSIVAIEDLHQHMYIAAKSVEGKYHLDGVLHYSLAGKRALFRVKYTYQRKWRSTISWFSLISLHARNDSGEPLRLNFRPGMSLVDISSSDDSGCALWRTLAYKNNNFEDSTNSESYDPTASKAFYLVNRKNDYGVAFVDGFPEFVKKPGNPFKVKLFNDVPLMEESVRLNVPSTSPNERRETSDQGDSSLVDVTPSLMPTSHVNIVIDKAYLTIFHEVPDANDRFPLVQACIDNTQVIVQTVSSKFRLISTFLSSVLYYDSQKNIWRIIIPPIHSSFFLSSRFARQGEANIHQRVPVHLYFRMGQVDISLTELSVDILLFLAGKLNLVGPYAVKSSIIFANRCKVDNHTGLSLLCHFQDNQEAVISGKQSSSVFLRHVAVADGLSEDSKMVSLSLAAREHFSTSPINVSLGNAQVLAWRTRVVSLKDSRTFPGPFIVVDVLKRAEEGLSVVVSPLLRIHNESGFSMKLRFRRTQETETECASINLQKGDTIDDSMAVFDAFDLPSNQRKALMSLSIGNFVLTFRPEITEYSELNVANVSVHWSEDLKGGKAVRLSGIFDKLNYRIRKTFGVESVNSSFSTVHCPISIGSEVSDMHFLVQTNVRHVPIMQPQGKEDISVPKASPVALQVQREITILPTVHVGNLLHTDIHVLLSEKHPDLHMTNGCDHIGRQAVISHGSSADLYANPAIIFFTVTLVAFSYKCKPVNTGDWVKKLHKLKQDIHYIDIELDFGGIFFASLRLSRGDRGILEATVYTSYMLENNTELSLLCFAAHQKPLSRMLADGSGSDLPPELGCFLPPKSSRSWLLKSNKVLLKWLDEKTSEAVLDLDMLSSFTELSLEAPNKPGGNHIVKLAVSLKPFKYDVVVPSRLVVIVPRYIISNESGESIMVRQCYLEDDIDGMTPIGSKQKTALHLWSNTGKRKEISLFDSVFKKHRNLNEDSLIFIQFCLKETGCSWSGPICVASLGRFFLKFRTPIVSPGFRPSLSRVSDNWLTKYAAVHTVEEDSSLVLHFYMPPNNPLPYRIENCLYGTSITYFQKDSMGLEMVASGKSVDYVWDDLNLPHKLVVQIAGMCFSFTGLF
ncbi:hypothetical protein QJS10_CPB13g00147 [Acorus calamus]|uniref:Vacuolar protein sorting-associated protein 13 VPS13 adaptor binding domain-containing protein n=1 Tax=Acorus calamus TaxID=4465 RepID=A0AAV9DHY1_ACOCL|nr:hypothetical protein QJS10_CPB13g00147 [Acorus calamus]